MKPLVSILILIALLVPSTRAATYYVTSSTGNDSAAGSIGAPWLTLYTSIPKLSPGDTLIATGTFSEAAGYGTPRSVSGSGTVGNPITVLASNAVVNLQDNSADTGIYIFTGSYVVLDGFGFTSTLPTGAYMGGFFSFDGSNCIAKNCVFTNAYGSHDVAAGGNDHMVCIQTHGNLNTFSNLFFHEINDADLFRVWGTNNLITCCIVSNCLNQYYDSGSVTKLHADLMQFWYTGIGSVSNVIERCLFLNNGGNQGVNGVSGGMMSCGDTSNVWYTNAIRDITYRNNVFAWHSQWIQNYAPSWHCYNNVFYQCGSSSFSRIVNNAGVGTANVQNNVFINGGYGEGGNGSTKDYCAWDSASQSNSPSLSSGYGASNFVTTATACGFVNASNFNFRLTPSSILRGRGVNLSSDPNASAVDLDGNARPSSGAWDIGPYQYVSPTQTPRNRRMTTRFL